MTEAITTAALPPLPGKGLRPSPVQEVPPTVGWTVDQGWDASSGEFVTVPLLFDVVAHAVTISLEAESSTIAFPMMWEPSTFTWDLPELEKGSRCIVAPGRAGSLVERFEIELLKQDLYGSDHSRRRSALLELATMGEPTVSALVALEFQKPNIELDWLASLTLAAEKTQFTNPDDREQVKAGLRRAAVILRQVGEARWEPIAWSAIRRYASMLRPQEAAVLADFLGFSGAIDTRQVTLQAIQNVFAFAPAPVEVDWQSLRELVYSLAQDTMNSHGFVAGRVTALVQNALLAAAALRDARLPQLATQVARWCNPWFSQQTADYLRSLVSRWAAVPTSDSSKAAAIDNLTVALGNLIGTKGL